MTDLDVKRNFHLLVIDDNRSVHDAFRKILCPGLAIDAALESAERVLFDAPAPAARRPPFEMDSAYQGAEGLELVQSALRRGRPYAMAFVDVRMPPGWDGIETTAKIWAIDPDLEIVICTAYAGCSWDEMVARLGQSDRLVILKKPFETVEILQLASALTEKWCLHEEVKGRLKHLESLVAERTGVLETTNERLAAEIVERKQAQAAREQLIAELQEALAKVKLLSGLVPICSSCKKIRDDQGFWKQVETYVAEHSEAKFSHGPCPDCARQLYRELYEGA